MRNIPIGVLAAQVLAQGGDGGGETPGGGGTVTGPWTFDSRYLDANHSLADSDTSVQNDTASTDVNPVHTKQVMLRSDTNIYYWEIDVTAGDASVSGQTGVVNAEFLPTPTESIGDSLGIGIGAIGQVRHDNAVLTTLTGYGVGDIIMVAFQPSTGQIWFGYNGTWDADPDVDSANATPGTVADIWRVSCNPVDPNRAFQLISETASFNYTPPTACTALEECPQEASLRVDSMTVVTVEAPFENTQLAVSGMRIITVVEE